VGLSPGLPGQPDSPKNSNIDSKAIVLVGARSYLEPNEELVLEEPTSPHLVSVSTENDKDFDPTSPCTDPTSSACTATSSRRLSEMKRSMGMAKGGDLEDYTRSVTRRLVTRPSFEGVVSAVIMLNVCVMTLQIQYSGFDIGHKLEYRWYEVTAAETWTGASVAFDVFDYIFGSIYIAELLIKMHAFRLDWIRDPWNWFDGLIVGFWLLEKPFKDVLTLPADATLLRTARLFKLLRLVKIIKTLHGFDSLYLLVTTLKGSGQILGWSCMLLVVVQMLIAFVIFFLLSEAYFKNELYPIEERRKVFEYFGTFSRAMLSMFEMTLANWPPVCRLLVENFSEWFMIFFITHKLTIGFAVIGVINGVFMQETFKVASSDDAIMMRSKEREVRTYSEKMKRLFVAADESGDGMVDFEEFRSICDDAEIRTWLSSMEIPVRDPEILFRLWDVSEKGELSADDMIRGALKLRGAAKTVDLLTLQKTLDSISLSVAALGKATA
jgi:voltage-gated sodium channel